MVGPGIGVRAGLEQHADDFHVRVVPRRQVKRGPVPFPVDAVSARAHVHPCTGFEQRAHDGRGALFRSVVQGRVIFLVTSVQCGPRPREVP